MNRKGFNGLIIYLGFIGFFFIKKLTFAFLIKSLYSLTGIDYLSYLISYIVVGIPVYLTTYFLFKKEGFPNALGLKGKIIPALIFSLFCTIPMLLGYFSLYHFNRDITFYQIVTGAIAAAFFEELFFRGYVFGQIFRYLKFGFIPSLLIPSLVFASLHLYQSTNINVMTGIFFTTLLGSALFAWVYAEWDFNLWVPIFLHFFMNLFWMIFSAGDNALGGIFSNIFRIVTIVLIIVLTILYKKRKKLPLMINSSNLMLKRSTE